MTSEHTALYTPREGIALTVVSNTCLTPAAVRRENARVTPMPASTVPNVTTESRARVFVSNTSNGAARAPHCNPNLGLVVFLAVPVGGPDFSSPYEVAFADFQGRLGRY